MDLASKTCTPCEQLTEKYTIEQAQESLSKLKLNWEITDETKWLKITLKRGELGLKDYPALADLAHKISKMADEQDHHPRLYLTYYSLRVELRTFVVDGLTENDFIIAAKIEELLKS